ncbi:hypothetical protein H6F73_25200 [Microcoleus sp. FACHB-68]|nr:hypothetical protein [Microcoleus sp. FACHB-68]
MTKAHSQTLWQDVVNSLKTTAAAIKRWVIVVSQFKGRHLHPCASPQPPAVF